GWLLRRLDLRERRVDDVDRVTALAVEADRFAHQRVDVLEFRGRERHERYLAGLVDGAAVVADDRCGEPADGSRRVAGPPDRLVDLVVGRRFPAAAGTAGAARGGRRS